MDGFTSIRDGEDVGRGMTFHDIAVILCVFTRFPNLQLDLTALARALRRDSRARDAVSARNIQPRGDSGDSSAGLAAYLQHISRYVSFLEFISALKTIGCAQLADVLLVERLGKPMLAMTSSDTSHSTPLSKFYNSVKGQLQSGHFADKLASLNNVSIFLIKEVEALHHPATRQSAFDKLAVVTCIKVNLYNTSDEKWRAISKMQDNNHRLMRDAPGGLDTRSSDIVYWIVMCMNARANGEFEAAKYHLDEAKGLNTVYSNVFFKFLIWQTQALLYRTMHARDGSIENLHESMSACHLGMSCAVSEPDITRDPWMATFMMFSAMLLLRIGQTFEILPGNKPFEKNIKDATEILAGAKRHSPSWTPRREMMYKLCMARVHEDSDRGLATVQCDDAIQLTEAAAYTAKDRRNLQNYLGMLLD